MHRDYYDTFLKPSKIDKDIIDQLNKDIIDEENLSKHKAHICLEPNYERDYKYLCPEGWIKNKNGQCWGLHYDGHCESLKYFQEYNDNEKKEFELSCCVLWPNLKSDNKKKNKIKQWTYHKTKKYIKQKVNYENIKNWEGKMLILHDKWGERKIQKNDMHIYRYIKGYKGYIIL
ncbi:hypothetical protein PFMG_04943 [Plasmodium falciparum IGH-CR14]|uniref:CPW-WPC domain-containing protein n=1 Tax=Plasmodium falciparum IGH-CR14 TaxID=580059 RepID=A0A0L1IHX9_PLAFA|nr:hypothetical protein PFMG_04943 [Plasmodium falciparum IGH-CR14]